jgi:hypothetical protein
MRKRCPKEGYPGLYEKLRPSMQMALLTYPYSQNSVTIASLQDHVLSTMNPPLSIKESTLRVFIGRYLRELEQEGRLERFGHHSWLRRHDQDPRAENTLNPPH